MHGNNNKLECTGDFEKSSCENIYFCVYFKLKIFSVKKNGMNNSCMFMFMTK